MSKNETANSKARSATAESVSDAVAALQRGDVIVFPTETLYGLGADAFNGAAVEKVCQLKGRDPNSPFPVLVADQVMLHTLVTDIPIVAQRLMEKFWPGPLTLVLAARQDIPKPLCNAAGRVGVRISSQPIAARLVKALGHPLTATSANPSGQEPARTLQEAKSYFTGKVKVFIDGGILISKLGSTVVEILGEQLKIIRAGEISLSMLQGALGEGTKIE